MNRIIIREILFIKNNIKIMFLNKDTFIIGELDFNVIFELEYIIGICKYD